MEQLLLETKAVSKTYSTHKALQEASVIIPKGKIVGLLGPNGAGKTTLIRIINQITGPDSGTVDFDGQRLAPKHIEDIGYLPEERGLYKKMKVGEQLVYLAQLKGLSKAEAITELKKWFIKFDIKDWWDKPVEELSKGMQQKTQFIATVVHQPKLIILDEPFSGFDPINANLIKDEILELKAKGSTIVFSTHRMESVEELCDHIVLINKSKVILQGSKADIIRQFSDNTYTVTTKEAIIAHEQFEIIHSEINAAAETVSSIRIKDTSTPNQVLGTLIQTNNILSFAEKKPNFNEIFIKVVGSDGIQEEDV
jgi:ABC-2 type transport system ATP-binding protein